MTRNLVVAGIAVVVAFGSSVAAQNNRPDLSGNWTLVAEKSTPDNASAFGKTMTIAQANDALTMDTQMSQVKFESGANGATARSESGGSSRFVYQLDGAEHEVPRGNAPSNVPAGALLVSSSSVLNRTYRAVWTGPQLVIMTRDEIQITRRDQAPVTVKRVIRQALAIDRDGSLVADSLIVADPIPDFFFNASPSQSAPVPVRSVYRKGS